MTIERARSLRRDQTEAERKLWARPRNRQLGGLKFRRQFTVGPYVADFVCYRHRLVVELDGGQHVTRADYDRMRTEFLERNGFHVLRFWNNDVMQNVEGVLATILRELGRE